MYSYWTNGCTYLPNHEHGSDVNIVATLRFEFRYEPSAQLSTAAEYCHNPPGPLGSGFNVARPVLFAV